MLFLSVGDFTISGQLRLKVYIKLPSCPLVVPRLSRHTLSATREFYKHYDNKQSG